jgi:hypothetical protein
MKVTVYTGKINFNLTTGLLSSRPKYPTKILVGNVNQSTICRYVGLLFIFNRPSSGCLQQKKEGERFNQIKIFILKLIKVKLEETKKTKPTERKTRGAKDCGNNNNGNWNLQSRSTN